MPLSGGPSDKRGNRYELRWIVRKLVDLVTGRVQWIRIEPPGEDAIEFRCSTNGIEEAHQVKRGLSGGGHWTIAALGEVLHNFGSLLYAEPNLVCAFSSEHAAPELAELSERARDSRDLEEFTARFLTAKSIEKPWNDLRTRWNVDDRDAWQRLQRITITAVSEKHLQVDTDAILGLLFNATPETVRAVLSDLALESIHKELRREHILDRLAVHGIRLIESVGTLTVAPSTSPPPGIGLRRVSELEDVAALIRQGTTTVFISGIAGIGKTTLAAQFASEWKGPICWIDCGLLQSEIETASAVAEFIEKVLGDPSVRAFVARGKANLDSIWRLSGKIIGSHRCLVVWDGTDRDFRTIFQSPISGLASTVHGGAQLVTSQVYEELSAISGASSVHVGRMDKAAVRKLLVDAYPEARVPDLEAAEEFAQGHPYLLNLLTGMAGTLDLGTAMQTMRTSEGKDAFLAQLVSHLDDSSRTLLKTVAWIDVPIRGDDFSRLGGTVDVLRDLTGRCLIVRAGPTSYRVHEILAGLIKRLTPESEALELHQRAALFLRGLEHHSWIEVRAALRHARAASMHDIARQAAAGLLRNVTDGGLAREAAENLIHDSLGAKWWYPHFVLGKCARMSEDLEAALAHYANAERCAEQTREREVSRYERASVLCGLGRRDEADELYRELLDAESTESRVEARSALALGMAKKGDYKEAMRLLDEAAVIAEAGGLVREEAEVWQARGEILAEREDWEEARASIKKAHGLRMSIEGGSSFDIYGWYHLLKTAVVVERALGNKRAAQSAAHGLWRCGVLSGSLAWETTAAQTMCMLDPDESDFEVTGAVQKLRQTAGDTNIPATARLVAFESLVLCEWSLGHYEGAIEAIAEVAALGEEHKLNTTVFAHLIGYPQQEENIVRMPGGGYGLIVPRSETADFVERTATAVFSRRPELARYSVLMMGTPKVKPKNRPRNPKKRKSQKKR